MKKLMLFLGLLFFIASCSSHKINPKVNKDNIKPGSSVKLKGKVFNLYKGQISVGENFVKKAKGSGLGFKFNNRVTIVSFVPSIDTPVCEAQTHVLGETKLNPEIERVTISRDLPMAQKRFSKEAKLTNIHYFSDYKYGKFGKKAGILIKEKELLARGVMVIDSKGVIRYQQFVSELTQLPDMKKAFEVAEGLVGKK